jgi:anti-anti-sigma factor
LLPWFGRTGATVDDHSFSIRSSWDSGTALFELDGDVDAATVPELSVALDAVNGARAVVLDLTGTTYLDSSAINSLLRAKRELAQSGVAFSIVCPPDGVVRRALEITGVMNALGVVDARP